MHKHRYLHPAPLIALAGMALSGPAALAQQPGQPPPAAPAAQAQTNSSASSAAAPSSRSGQSGGLTLQLMGTLVEVHPTVKLEARHDDNIYSTPDKQVSDQILVLTPALEFAARQGPNTYKLRLATVIGNYQSHSSENYANTSLNALADLDLGTRLRARLEGDYTDGADARGSTNNALSQTPDRYRQTRGRGVFSFGAPGARGRLDLELGRSQREYLNNRATTVASDHAVDDLGATFNWRVGPKTSLLFQGKRSTVDYDYAASTLGSTESAFLVGGSWEASAKTSGTFRIGLTKKDFDDAARSSGATTSWMGAVRWSPRTYSHVDLDLTRAPSETSGGVGNYIDRTSTAAHWTHAWSSRLTTEARASYLADSYQGAARNDNTQAYGLKATYRMRRWLNFGAEYGHSVRDSEDNNFDFKRNVVILFVEATL